MPSHSDLFASFEFPDRLMPKAYHAFQKALLEVCKRNGIDWSKKEGRESLTVFLYQAVNFYAAIEAGLILNWKSDLLPVLRVDKESDLDSLPDVGTIEWAGQQVIDWIEVQKHVPKVSFWRWPMRWIAKAGLRQNSFKPVD